MQERRSTDASDQIDGRPAVLSDELAGRRCRLAEGAGDHVGQADRARQRKRHIALRTGEGPHPEPRRALGGTDLDPSRNGAQPLVAFRIEVAGRVVEKPHDLIIALSPHGPSGGRRGRCKFHPVWMEEG